MLENDDLQLRAIYSRSKETAEKLASEVPFTVDLFYDSPDESGRSFEKVLAEDDIQAVVCCLPILVQLDFVKRCLTAGKHVLSEKPIAGDTRTAAAHIAWYRNAQKDGSVDKRLIWAVAEEFRLMPAFDHAALQIAKLGRIQTFSASGYTSMGPGNPFYDTAWRKVPGYQGGFLLDGGVHWTAALIHLLGKDKPARVAAFSTLLQDHLAPVDTLHATVQLQSRATGIFGYSAGISNHSSTGMDFEVVCDDGRVVVQRAGQSMRVTVSSAGCSVIEDFDSTLNTQYEINCFIESILDGSEAEGETPEKALADLMFLQAMLESGAAGGCPKEIDL